MVQGGQERKGMPRRICPNCGREVEPGQRFCPNCFHPLEEKGLSQSHPAFIFCPYCGYKNEPNSLYCNRCGFQLMERCSICGTLSPIEGSVTCPKCGTPLIAGRDFALNLKRKKRKLGFLLRLYSLFLLLSLLLGVLWWVKFSLILAIVYRFFGLLVLLFLAVVLIFALLNTYHSLQDLRKEEKQIKQWAKTDED
jgi:RNA polymerase subunit RPABC4/transcription elongation factor Spt4